MEITRDKFMLMAVIAIMALTIVGTVFAQPVGTGTLNPTSSTRGTDASAGQLDAQGGNVTNVDIDAWSITSKWAGFYGDITGAISLEDGSGNTFYNWSDASPTGEVFATRNPSTPTWGSIACADGTTITAETSALDLGSGADNITNTFCETCGNHSAFSVGTTDFSADQCTYRTNAFNNAGAQTTDWDQVLLTDTNYALYTTIIDQDTLGFDNINHDFQLLVGENSSSTTLTSYYFFVEIV